MGLISTTSSNVSLASTVTAEQFKKADEAFAMRGENAKINLAYDLYKKYYAEAPENFETGWRLSMASYFVGNRVLQKDDEKEKTFAQGRDAGLASLKLNPKCAAAHFWTAINMALYGGSVGAFKMLNSISDIEKHLEASIKIDPTYASAGAFRLLGTIKQKLPGILGGSNRYAREYYEKAIATVKDEPLNYLMLAKLYRYDLDEPQKAIETARAGLKFNPPTVDRFESVEAYAELKQMAPSVQAKI